MKKAVRIQRKRTKGWRAPENSIYVGRPTKWGNPWTVIPERRDAQTAVDLYREYALRELNRDEIGKELAGKVLLCWCAVDEPCHADVLVELANLMGVPSTPVASS